MKKYLAIFVSAAFFSVSASATDVVAPIDLWGKKPAGYNVIDGTTDTTPCGFVAEIKIPSSDQKDVSTFLRSKIASINQCFAKSSLPFCVGFRNAEAPDTSLGCNAPKDRLMVRANHFNTCDGKRVEQSHDLSSICVEIFSFKSVADEPRN